MNELVVAIVVVFGILQLILFFKLWGMTNDIKEIKNKYLRADNIKSPSAINEINKYKDGLLVVELKTGKQMRLGESLENGNYKCYSNGSLVGEFNPSEFMEFERWRNEVYKK